MANEKVAPKVADDGALEEATVRHGTVVWGPADNPVHSGPGQKVRLPRAVVAKHRARGILHDPQTPEIPVGLGPNFNVENGVQVTETGANAPADKAE
jgi:hypothetical protein